MFVLSVVADMVRIPPSMFVQPTLTAVHAEIDKKYPNRVLMDVGLVICRYGSVLQIGDGVCACGDGAAHHEVVFRLVVFRPFVEEVCLGTIAESNEDGVRVSLGFFDDIFIPAYWMLRPSQYDAESGLWVWTPNYGDDGGGEEEEEEQRFEMEIGAEVRFRVKSLNFTRVTNTVKGVQATTTTTSHRSKKKPTSTERSSSTSSNAGAGPSSSASTGTDVAKLADGPLRRRSSSVDLSDSEKLPASFHITASICEDGLGLTTWWSSPGEEEEGEEEEDQENTAQEDGEGAEEAAYGGDYGDEYV